MAKHKHDEAEDLDTTEGGESKAGATGRKAPEPKTPEERRKSRVPDPNEGNATSNSAGGGNYPEDVLATHGQLPEMVEGEDRPVIPALAKSADRHPWRDDEGNLTRAGMEDIIKRGESFTHNGVVVSREDQIPTEEEVHKAIALRKDAGRNHIRAQIRQLEAQESRMGQ
jgi:hypothetical protein